MYRVAHCLVNTDGSSVSPILQIVRLALFKLFDNLSIEVLVGSMMELMVASHEKPEVWGEESLQVTPKINVSQEFE